MLSRSYSPRAKSSLPMLPPRKFTVESDCFTAVREIRNMAVATRDTVREKYREPMTRPTAWIFIAAAMLATLRCFSGASSSEFRRDAGACEVPAGVAGEWTNRRSTQIGRATMRFDLRCDCSYTVTVSTLGGRIVENGQYRAGNGSLLLSRSRTETSWPYELRDDRLIIKEFATESYEYRRARSVSCD